MIGGEILRKVKITICIFLIMLIFFGGIVWCTKQSKTNDKVGDFNLSDYEGFIQKVSSYESVGEVSDSKEAKEVARDIWVKKYGESEIKKMKPILVAYDYNSNVWLVKGTLPSNWIGGVPYILINKEDGKILGVWHTK